MEGISRAAGKPTPEFAHRLAKAIGEKYAEQGYSPEPNQWDEGGLFVFIPRQCIAWSSSSKTIFNASGCRLNRKIVQYNAMPFGLYPPRNMVVV